MTIINTAFNQENVGNDESVVEEVTNEVEANNEDQDDDEGIPDFPESALANLDEMIHRPRWVVPVLAKCELEVLLEASIDLCSKGIDTRSEPCQRFFREGLTISFSKILTDEAVNSWKFDIHKCILKNCEKLIELIVIKLPYDWFPLLDLLAVVFNPGCKFHNYNCGRPSEASVIGNQLNEGEVFARSQDQRNPRGWLIDLINLFGNFNGFQKILDRFSDEQSLNVAVVCALLRPFGLCYEFLSISTIEKYFLPIINIVPTFLENLTDEELKKEAKNEAKSDAALSIIIKSIKNLASRIPSQQETVRNLEIFRLKMILRLLQISSFNGKMNALNEVNRVIGNVTYQSHRHSGVPSQEEEWLTVERMAEWIKENRVLQIVLRDSLHQPQYVEKLEKIIRFIIKEKTLTTEDLDDIWAAQHGKHEAIIKNIHDLLAKLAWDFSGEQLDHLFECFQMSWSQASKKQREKLLRLIRRLAEDDKDGVMAHKVLNLLWSLAHSDDVPTEIMDQALAAHVKILDYSCSHDRDAQKDHWLHRCVEELNEEKWVLPALKQIKEICCSYTEAPSGIVHNQNARHLLNYRNNIISNLQNQFSLVIVVTENLINYMKKTSLLLKEAPNLNPMEYFPDSRYNHVVQVQERLNFLKFLLRDGQLWLCAPQAVDIWKCLAENAVFPIDRESCFRWFSKLMGEEPDLDPEINRKFFEGNILQLDPTLLTENGMKCFERFFKAVNVKEGKLVMRGRIHLMDDLDLIGLDYLWRVTLCSSEKVSQRAIEIIREIYTNLGPKLESNQIEIHQDFIGSCMERLKAMFDTVSLINRDKDSLNKVHQDTTRMCRVLNVLFEYINECDAEFGDDRTILPLIRSCRGKQIALTIQFLVQGRQPDDLEAFTHTNDTIGSIKRQIMHRIKQSATQNFRIDLYLSPDILEPLNDKILIGEIPTRDKIVLTAKLSQNDGHNASSPDSSSDSSLGSNQKACDGSNIKAEGTLPGVIFAKHPKYCQFLIQIADLGCHLNLPHLRDSARTLLGLVPADSAVLNQLELITKASDSALKLENLIFSAPPSAVLYNLQVLYSCLMPALNPTGESVLEFQLNFLRSSGVKLVINMLTKNNFLSTADVATKRSAFFVVLKIAKLVFCAIEFLIVSLNLNFGPIIDNSQGLTFTNGVENTDGSSLNNTIFQVLLKAYTYIPDPLSDIMVRSVATRLAQAPFDKSGLVTARLAQFPYDKIKKDLLKSLWTQLVTGLLPDRSVIKALLKLIWVSAIGQMNLVTSGLEDIKDASKKISSDPLLREDLNLCIEGFECLTLVICLYPYALDDLSKDPQFQSMILSLIFSSKEPYIRRMCMQQVLFMTRKCSLSSQTVVAFLNLFSNVVKNKKNLDSLEFFQLFGMLLSFACNSNVTVPNLEVLLNFEINWLKQFKIESLMKAPLDGPSSNYEEQRDQILLEGHLYVTKELVCFLNAEKKRELGTCSNGPVLIRELIEDFIFPYYKIFRKLEMSGDFSNEQVVPVCSTDSTVIAAFDLIGVLCNGCVQNLKVLVEMLITMFYSDCEKIISDWDYLPPVGLRPQNGFVGLKNAGATCYMNSVIQQLFMIKPIREDILRVEGAVTESNEDFSGEDRVENEINLEICDDENSLSSQDSRKEYNVGILKQLQAIFGHLHSSKLQYYVPRGMWKHFRLQGEPINLREQHDACEFYNILVDSVNEALKSLGGNQVLNKILGGSFSDQKICKTCPHRYTREDSFTILNIEIRNYTNLYESLEQYVKGDLLEEDNAYYCEKCDKKVDTVKRSCLKKLPPILAIQLKRFDYDWERETSIKFNDYFEFPRDLDMEPYTVAGLAKNNELIDYDPEDLKKDTCSKYKLTGVVVHSGQASGGHYYSYILHKSGNEYKWFKFDDGDVTECKMDDDEEMKVLCFGGDYQGEQIFDNVMKRVSYRRQKRWWNAYLLFYTRLDDISSASTSLTESLVHLNLDDSGLSLESGSNDLNLDSGKSNSLIVEPGKLNIVNLESGSNDLHLESQKSSNLNLDESCRVIKMPKPIEKSVLKQNMKFLHARSQYSKEYFGFIKNVIILNHDYVSQPPRDYVAQADEIAVLCTQLVSHVLFSVGFHTKKSRRGPAQEWCDALQVHLRCSRNAREWFIENVIFHDPEQRISEYLLDCPSPEIRLAFSKILAILAHSCINDPPRPTNWSSLEEITDEMPVVTLGDQILLSILLIPKKDISEYGSHLVQYFQFFCMYASFGSQEKFNLLKLNVVERFMTLAMDDSPGSSMKHQYPEFSKMYQLVSCLIRSCDVKSKCTSSQENKPILPNPYNEPKISEPLMLIQPKVAEILYRQAGYVKKIIEDAHNCEDTIRLLKFCCWENPSFSSMVLSELLWHVAYSYFYELKPYFELLLHMLLLEDSWQNHRIHNALEGIPNDREGLFPTMFRTKVQYQKRAYQCMKCMVALFSNCKTANMMLNTNHELKQKWATAVCWLNEELERRTALPPIHQFYNNCTSQTPSNESSNGYHLERSPSARDTLEKAYELLPEGFDEVEVEESEPDVPDEMAPPLPPTENPAESPEISSPAPGCKPARNSPVEPNDGVELGFCRNLTNRPLKTPTVTSVSTAKNVCNDSEQNKHDGTQINSKQYALALKSLATDQAREANKINEETVVSLPEESRNAENFKNKRKPSCSSTTKNDDNDSGTNNSHSDTKTIANESMTLNDSVVSGKSSADAPRKTNENE